ncbi:FkbM family methyltransferase [Halorubrum aethiopicum]|uniref:FkbM family methyltransferase n=1 Tax=Halorubrum aethiopicum TaxID=1758255 RepID=UPI0018E2E145|nr:FkbM family methyltransferase [Halorubrum aethiopicum]
MLVNGQTGHQFSDDYDGMLEIDTRRADDLIGDNNYQPPDVCKIDMEGAEYITLDEFRGTFADSTYRCFFCGIHTEKIADIGDSVGEVKRLLRSLGFEIQYLGYWQENYLIEAIPPSLTD